MASDNVMKKQEEEIDLLKLAKVLWKKIWVILICAVVLGIAGYYWTYRKMYTSYRSSALLYVNNNSVSLGSAKLSISSGDIKAVNNLMETYSVILNSRNTLTEIIDETGIPFTYEELKNITNEAISYEELEDTTNETIDYEELKGYNLRKFWIRFSVICTPILIGLLYAGESGLIPYQLAQSLGAGLSLAISPIIAVLQGYLMVKLIDKVEEWLSKHL